MKKIYLFQLLILIAMGLHAQNPSTTSAMLGSCINPDEGTIDIIFDLNVNCPEADPNGILSGVEQMGFHSGANTWGTIIPWDDAGAVPAVNNGNDTLTVSINVEEYYGIGLGDLENIQVVLNNGYATPDDPWTIAFRDSLDGDEFGTPSPCSDMILIIAETPTCADLNQASSTALFSDAGDSESCVDSDDGLVRVDLDYGLACPEGDEGMVLAGAAALGFHSGPNDWAATVAWDDPNALQLVNDGNDNFSAVIDVASYYGVALADLNNIMMIANNGVANPDAAWDNAIRDSRDGGFGGSEPCSDLIMVISEAPECDLMSGVQNIELQHSFKATPNPFRNRTYIEFDNPNNEAFDLVISNLAGQTVRTIQGVSGERYLLERERLPSGMYIANLIDKEGNFATTKLAIK